MAFTANSKTITLGAAAVLSTAALVYFGNGLHPLWPLMWFAMLPLLLFSLRSSWRATAVASFLGWFVGCLNLFGYFHSVLDAPVSAWATVFGMESLGITLGVLLFRALVLRGRPWSALIAFPALWTTIEYVNNLTGPHGTGGSFSYSQLNFLPFLQLASLTGPWGMTFVLLLFPASIALAWHLRERAKPQAVRIFATGMALTVCVLAFGAARLAMTPHRETIGNTIRVGLIASDTRENSGVRAPGAETDRELRDYMAAAQKVIAQGAKIVIIPEHLGAIADQATAPTDAILQAMADEAGVTVIAGLDHRTVDSHASDIRFNEARIYTPHATMASYDKHHLLPPFESIFKPGDHLSWVPGKAQTIGVQICKDMDFTPLSRQYGQAGTALMLVPAWDFKVDGFWHGHIAVMRGVESGFSIARAARGGYLTVTDDRGRVLAEESSNAAPFATLVTDVPVAHDATLYLKWGDWFAWIAIAITILTMAQLFRPRISMKAKLAA